MRYAIAIVIITVAGLAAQALWPGPSRADTGDISVGGIWVFRLTQGAGGLTLEQRVRLVEQRITDVLSQTELRRGDLRVEVRPSGATADIVAAGIRILTLTPADAAGTGVPVVGVANQWAARLVEGLRRALPGREVIGFMYTQPRGTDPGELSRVVGTTWYWRRTSMNDDAQFVPADPRRYTIQFLEGGRIAVLADCNRGTGTYVLEGRTIEISRLAMTRAACASGSLDSRFLAGLAQAASYSVREGILVLELRVDSGTMRFSRTLP
jgi:heat shock protein HslJ